MPDESTTRRKADDPADAVELLASPLARNERNGSEDDAAPTPSEIEAAIAFLDLMPESGREVPHGGRESRALLPSGRAGPRAR